jgi:hypothetical protein
MTLKIERISGKRKTRIRLSGKLRSEHLDQVKAEIEHGGPRVDLDLRELDLVDVESVRFLNACEAEGISVLRCSPYTGNGWSGNVELTVSYAVGAKCMMA